MRTTWLPALLLCACDTGVHAPSGTPPPTGQCLEATRHQDWAWINDNILKTSCAQFTACHTGARPPGNLDLSPGVAYGQLIDVSASGQAGWKRVVPGDPDRSYLLVKLGGAQGPLGDGGLMPPNSLAICAEKVEAVRRWIAAGAISGLVNAGVIDASSVD